MPASPAFTGTCNILRSPAPKFVVGRDLQPNADTPALLSFVGRDRAAVLTGPHRGEHVEFLRDVSGAIEWLRWDGRLAHRQAQRE